MYVSKLIISAYNTQTYAHFQPRRCHHQNETHTWVDFFQTTKFFQKTFFYKKIWEKAILFTKNSNEKKKKKKKKITFKNHILY